jgi:hypothetical protein
MRPCALSSARPRARSVAEEHRKLAGAKEVARMKACWPMQLDSLRKHLEK